jgi:ATP-dependent Clp protease ATP-binding subunit ClpC
MFERYTEASRRAIFFARYEAAQEGSSYIETEHIFLGIFHDAGSRVDELFHVHDRLHEIQQRIRAVRQNRPALANDVDLPLTNESKRVLADAAEEAASLGSDWVDSEHLVLGLLREKKGFGAKIMSEFGIELASARSIVRSAPSANYPPFLSVGPDTHPEKFRNVGFAKRVAKSLLIVGAIVACIVIWLAIVAALGK